jgi:hypothetical protein
MGISQSLDIVGLYNQTTWALATLFKWFPYWGPIFFGLIFWKMWARYVQAQYMANIKWVLLEIKVPKEIHKSPLAMEIVLNALYQTSTGNWYDKYWKGKVKDSFSLEMVSIEGHIKFFIRAASGYKNVIEAQLYGQYPDIEIYEVPDYTRYVDYRGKEGEWAIAAVEYGLTKADPYPIKTYVDYKLDSGLLKEEQKIDPLTSVIEYLGSAGKGEQIWIQILVTGAGKRYTKKDGTLGDWKDEGKDEIKKLTGGDKKPDEVKPVAESDRNAAKEIERSLAKFGFDCGIRAMYLAKGDKFNASHMKALGGLWRPFSTNNLNGFKPSDLTFGFDFPWQDYNDFRLEKKKKKFFNAFKYRSWFNVPRKLKPFVLNSEELATIYHFPGGVSQTPTFGRIPSRKSEAPVNLPI